MGPQDCVDQVSRLVRRRKRARLTAFAAGTVPSADLPTSVDVFRSGRLVATLTAARDLSVDHLVYAAAAGLAADQLAATCDGWAPLTVVNPVTEDAWQGPDVAEVATRHDGVAHGWVAPALVIVAGSGPDSGDVHHARVPYRVHEGRLRWLPGLTTAWVDPPPALLAALVAVFPTAHPGPPSIPGGWPYEVLRTRLDIGVAAALADHPAALRMELYAAPGTLRHELLSERFAAPATDLQG